MKYLAKVSTEAPYDAYTMDVGVFALGKKSRQEALESVRSGLALYLLELELESRPIPEPVSTEATTELEEGEEFTWIEPAPVNPVVVELLKAMERAGVSQAELARRMGVSRTVVNRMLNPFTHDHKVSSLERIANALHKRLHVELV